MQYTWANSLKNHVGRVSLCLAILGPIVLVAAVGIGVLWSWFSAIPDLPNITLEYWGPGSFKPDDPRIVPFTVNVSQEDLDDLRWRLDHTRELTANLEGTNFTYGINTTYLKTFLRYWRDEYNWSERQAILNTYPQYRTQIGGLYIHFQHIKPDLDKLKGKRVVPVVIMHGWPGTTREFHEAVPMLTGQKEMPDVALELIVLSLPGFAWSEAAVRPGLGASEAAAIVKELMDRLGHDRFFVHASDWGAVVGSQMTLFYPQSVIALHTNFCYTLGKRLLAHMAIAAIRPSWVLEEFLVDRFWKMVFTLVAEEGGYFHQHVTKPDTTGVGLTDSPAGLAAYLLEKYSTWTNTEWRRLPDGGLENLDKNALLDTLTIYWFSKSITTSMRFYAEGLLSKHTWTTENIPTYVPTACVRFANEVGFFPELSLRAKYRNLKQITEYPKGGHFVGLEVPELLTKDLILFIKRTLKENEENKK